MLIPPDLGEDDGVGFDGEEEVMCRSSKLPLLLLLSLLSYPLP